MLGVLRNAKLTLMMRLYAFLNAALLPRKLPQTQQPTSSLTIPSVTLLLTVGAHQLATMIPLCVPPHVVQ
jgi:hypothetical protein